MTYIIAFFIIILLVVILGKSRKKQEVPIQETNKEFPDRTFNIQFFQNKVTELLEKGEIELANLNFAKLVEAVRQQNQNQNGQLQEQLDSLMSDYSDFRKEYGVEYPNQFLPPNERKSKKKETSNIEPSELLKKATALNKTDINAAISLIQQAIDKEPEYFAARKKLVNYMFKAGQKDEAIGYLIDYSNGSDIFHKSESLDQIAILLKKDKQNIEAIKYDCKSTYFYTMIQGPIAYNDFEGLCGSIVLKRNYKEEQIENYVNSHMIEFWGKKWLKDYYKEYRKIESSVSYDTKKTLKKLESYFAQKNLDDFEKYIEEMISR